MTGGTDFDFNFGNRGSGDKSIATGASDLAIRIPSRMDGCFHEANYNRFQENSERLEDFCPIEDLFGELK